MMSEQYRCLIRKERIAATPEEGVRQRLLHKMINELGYPAECLGVEQALHLLPHITLKATSLPDRRADVICFAKGIHPTHAMYPLLLVECKAVPLTEKVVKQVAGYNHYVGAYFIAVANDTAIRTGWYDPDIGEYCFINHLPRYQDLLASLRANETDKLDDLD